MANALISLVWIAHIVFFLLYVVPFFIPQKKFKKKLEFQFFYMLTIVLSNFLWGFLFLSKVGKYIFSCPVTTLMQYLRGYSLTDPLNYTHSFVAEFLQLFSLPPFPVKPVMLLLFLIVAIQYYKNL